MNFGEFLKNKRIEKGYSLRQLSYKIGLSHSYISEIEKGIFTKRETVEKIMDALELKKSEKEYIYKEMDFQKSPESIKKEIGELRNALKGNAVILDTTVLDLPVYGKGGAGRIGFLNLDTAIYRKKVIDSGFSKDSFLVEVCGDSMEPKIIEGDWVLVDPQESKDISGKIYVVTYFGETFIKQVDRPKNDLVVLKSYHPDYEDVYIDAENMKNLKIEGRVVKIIREVEL
ncbi:XRE family transcriptional regulator [uncultured Ilyobacter sp.]|uniref:XRE family transcriptional regulator n=1 Tax=uncultured Ilyobacter sp. TaxID=544433 RepID=UPI0029C09522|nr:XRE family transcriptional regulator [uncultured Ilyobacter sp.]